jgi:ketosteroid isomerase-like protein
MNEDDTRTTVDRFNDAINRHDLAAVTALLDDETVFENTAPPPDGTRIQGKAAVAAFWEKWFAGNAGARFDAEEVIVTGDRSVVRWVYRKMRDGKLAPARRRRVDGAQRKDRRQAGVREGMTRVGTSQTRFFRFRRRG